MIRHNTRQRILASFLALWMLLSAPGGARPLPLPSAMAEEGEMALSEEAPAPAEEAPVPESAPAEEAPAPESAPAEEASAPESAPAEPSEEAESAEPSEEAESAEPGEEGASEEAAPAPERAPEEGSGETPSAEPTENAEPAKAAETEGEGISPEALGEEALPLGAPMMRTLMIVQPTEPEEPYHSFTFRVGDQTVSEQILGDREALVAPASPEKEGYYFDGWFAGETRWTAFGTALEVTQTEETTLTARFIQARYVYFQQDGRTIYTVQGKPGDTVETDQANGAVALSATQMLRGWTQDGTPVNAVTLGDEDIVLRADVTEGSWLRFHENGGSYTAPVFYLSEPTVRPADPTRDGYHFAGWFDQAGDAEFTFGTPLTGTVDLYAKWTPGTAPYTVTYWRQNANDAGYSYERSEIISGATVDTEIVLTPSLLTTDNLNEGSLDNAVIRTRHFFKLKGYDQGLRVAGDGSTVVNVYFDRIEYTLTFDLGTDSRVKMTVGGVTYTGGRGVPRYSLTAHYEENLGSRWPDPTQITGPSNKGFSGWQMIYDNSYADQLQTMIPGVCAYFDQNGSTARTTTIRFNGTYRLHVFEYYLDPDATAQTLPEVRAFGGEFYRLRKDYYTDKAATTHSIASVAGYDVQNNRKPVTQTVTENGKTVYNNYFFFKPISYPFEVHNGTDPIVTTQTPFEADLSGLGGTPVRPANIPANHTFGGWYSTPDFVPGTEVHFAGLTMPAGGFAIFAKWDAPTVTAVLYDTSGVEVKTVTLPYDSAIPRDVFDQAEAVIAQTLLQGSTQTGWVTMDGGRRRPFDKNTLLTADVALYPQIANAPETPLKVVYSAGAGSGNPPVDPGQYVPGSEAAALSAAGLMPPDGQVFLHWQDAAGRLYAPGDRIPIVAEDVTLTAQYGPEAGKTSLTYHNGTDSEPELGIVNNAAVPLKHPNAFGWSQGNQVFIGWNTRADGSGTYMNPGDAPRITLDDEATENHLYAQWAPQITVTVIGGQFVYDGQAHGATVAVSPGLSAYNLELVQATSNATATHVAEGAVTALCDTLVIHRAGQDVTARLPITRIDDTLQIIPRRVTLTSGSATKTYDGTALTDSGMTVSGEGFVQGEGASYTFSGTQTDVGQSENTFAYALNAGTKAENYAITTAYGTLDVTRRPVTLTSGSATKTYDGTALTDSGMTVSGEGFAPGEGASLTFTGSQTDVGQSENAFTYTLIQGMKAENYEITTAYGTLTVKAAPKKRAAAAVAALTPEPEPLQVTLLGDLFFDGAQENPLYRLTETITAPGRLVIGNFVGEEEAAAQRGGLDAVTLLGHADAQGAEKAFRARNVLPIARAATLSLGGGKTMAILPLAEQDGLEAAQAAIRDHAGATLRVVYLQWIPQAQEETPEALRTRRRAFARALVQAGAEIVLGLGEDGLQPMERIGKASVFYGLGDVLEEGDALAVGLSTEDELTLTLHPIQGGAGPALYAPGSEGAARILRTLAGN